MEFAQRQTASIVVPAAVARLLADRAVEAWGPQAAVAQGAAATIVGAWPNRRAAANAPMGGCTIAWGQPSAGLATVVELGWNPAREGDPGGVCRALNALIGWPVLRSA